MYESPINIIYNDIQYKVVEEMEKNVVSAVQSYGIDVNKEELLKALRYDRQQYEKGYTDAKAEQRWIPCTERLPEEKGEYIVTYHPCYWDNVKAEVKVGIDSFRGKTSWAKRKHQRVIAWMPLPEPYKGGE